MRMKGDYWNENGMIKFEETVGMRMELKKTTRIYLNKYKNN